MPDLDQEYFHSIPWCAKLLAEKDVVVVPTPSRRRKESTEDELVAVTLKTEKTIRSWLTFYKRPAAGVTRVHEIYNLLSLGPGVNGYAHLVAGGIIGVILDECMGILGLVNKSLGFDGAESFMVTANLNINYLKAVPTPGLYLATATLREVKGRKCYFGASLKNGEGTVLAVAESLWIDVAAKL
ncbi:MAG: hypothetical protein ALECFALPRED_004847 [Alectoria fallacina]|uniref:Thioesterase domain-containing protein n=1 Tax=Alectoria fallacina TaxID=1903189 RepID=A0A8H3I1X0_9LECA|nr:MAG: hypothetical protein ALECFALPRED_004847 [Alectoria fallacina]